MVVLLDPEEGHDDVLRANRSRERKYMFDVVSDARADQHDVYAATAKTLISSVMEGYNATVFAYGATGKMKEKSVGLILQLFMIFMLIRSGKNLHDVGNRKQSWYYVSNTG